MSKEWIEKTSKALHSKASAGGVELKASFTKNRVPANRACHNTESSANPGCHDTKTQDESK